MDPPERHKDGSISLEFKFQLDRFECEELIVAVSNLYPGILFVLGTVAPSVDEQQSLLAHKGQVWRWRLPNAKKNALSAKIPEETDDNADEFTWALAEADSEMMDAVMDRWNEKVDQKMAEVAKSNRKRNSR